MNAVAGALLLGLAHAAHCAAMCGPFALRVGRRPRAFVAWWLGKTFTYVFLGAVAGAGGAAALGPLQRPAALGVGLALVGAGLLALLRPGWAGRLTARISRRIAPLVAWMPTGGAVLGPFTLGVATGWLPCGATLLAVMTALASGGALTGSLVMAAFGAGTAPALAAVALAGGYGRLRWSGPAWRRVSAGLILAAGCLALWRAGLVTPGGACPACSS